MRCFDNKYTFNDFCLLEHKIHINIQAISYARTLNPPLEKLKCMHLMTINFKFHLRTIKIQEALFRWDLKIIKRIFNYIL